MGIWRATGPSRPDSGSTETTGMSGRTNSRSTLRPLRRRLGVRADPEHVACEAIGLADHPPEVVELVRSGASRHVEADLLALVDVGLRALGALRRLLGPSPRGRHEQFPVPQLADG